MKLVIQIPCHNEAETLPVVIAGIPKSIPGIAGIEIVVIDDGSNDKTGEVARNLGVHHVIRNISRLGLARTFRSGVDHSLRCGADIIVNMDGDNQYKGSDIPRLIEPILSGSADMVIGDRQTDTIQHFSPSKKFLQRFGSSIIRKLSRTDVSDAVSGFRAMSRAAALKLTILSNYTYTLEAILQAHSKGFTIKNVLIETNPKTRESRLIKDLRTYLAFSLATIIRVFTMYNPLRVFIDIGAVFVFAGVMLSARFLYYYLTSGGAGHLQSLIFAAVCMIAGVSIILGGILADLIQFNRRLLEDILERLRKLELRK